MVIEDAFAGVSAQAPVWVITLGMHVMKLLVCGNSDFSASLWFYWSSCLPAPSCLDRSACIFETSV